MDWLAAGHFCGWGLSAWEWRGGGGGGVEVEGVAVRGAVHGGDKMMSPWKVAECRREPEMTPCNKSH